MRDCRALFIGGVAAAVIGCGNVVSTEPDGGGEGGGADAAPAVSCEACDPNASCDEEGATTTCICDEGYEGDGLSCDDVNECAEDNGGCDENALCLNVPGSRDCECLKGHVGGGETCEPIWIERHEVSDLRFNTDNYGPGLAAAYDGRIYFGPESNDDSVYFKSIGIFGGDVQDEPLPAEDGGDFCACGSGGPLVSEPSAGICLFANDANCFDGSEWTEVERPPEFGTGSAASAGAGGAIYEAGDRGGGKNFHRYEPGSGFSPLPDHPAGVDRAAGAVHDGMFYAAGGATADGHGDRLYAFDTEEETWVRLADLPEDSERPRGAAPHDGRILLFARSEILVYDIADNVWLEDTVSYPEGEDFRPVAYEGQVFVVGDRDTSVVIYELNTY